MFTFAVLVDKSAVALPVLVGFCCITITLVFFVAFTVGTHGNVWHIKSFLC